MKLNTKTAAAAPLTATGAHGSKITAQQQLVRLTLACMLGENIAYTDGRTVMQNIADVVPRVPAQFVAELALKARSEFNLRHVPLYLLREVLRQGEKTLVRQFLPRVIQRPDEMAEFLAHYWRDQPDAAIANCVKDGLAEAFLKFNEYSLSKYKKTGDISLRDVMRLVHPRPRTDEQRALFGRVVSNTLATPDTWETELSAGGGKGKKDSWERLLEDKKIGAMALLKNLRNMDQAGVDFDMVAEALASADYRRVLPFRFITAARHAPRFLQPLGEAMVRASKALPQLKGKTDVLVDVSGSMWTKISAQSEISRLDMACGLAIVIRATCPNATFYATGTNTGAIKPYEGFALADAISNSRMTLGGNGIFLKNACDYLFEREKTADRLIVITDEQDQGGITAKSARAYGKRNYILNVSTEKVGIAYDKFTHISGCSEAVVNYIREQELFEDSI